MSAIAQLSQDVWGFFYGTIERWNNYITELEAKQFAQDHPLVPVTVASQYPRLPPHAPIQTYTELNFPYNLAPEEKVRLYGDQEVDGWIQDFERLNINIGKMIRTEHTLPDQKFLKKRYLKVLKEIHPDKPMGSNMDAIELNGAREVLERLYERPNEQIHLFHTILDAALEETKNHAEFAALNPVTEKNSTSSYVVLWLVGAGLGMVYVLREKGKK